MKDANVIIILECCQTSQWIHKGTVANNVDLTSPAGHKWQCLSNTFATELHTLVLSFSLHSTGNGVRGNHSCFLIYAQNFCKYI